MYDKSINAFEGLEVYKYLTANHSQTVRRGYVWNCIPVAAVIRLM